MRSETVVVVALVLAITVIMMVLFGCQMPLR
jgi:hypothetical protein